MEHDTCMTERKSFKHDASKVAHVSDGLDEGGSRGGRDTTQWASKISASRWPVCSDIITLDCYRIHDQEVKTEDSSEGLLGIQGDFKYDFGDHSCPL